MIATVRATREHALALGPRLLGADELEVRASSGMEPTEACESSVAASQEAYALVVEGEVLALWGVAPLGAWHLFGALRPGAVWCLVSRDAPRHRRLLARRSRAALEDLLTRWDWLGNYVDARYVSALRWVQWLGFHVAPHAVPWGVARLPFHEIYIRAPARAGLPDLPRAA